MEMHYTKCTTFRVMSNQIIIENGLHTRSYSFQKDWDKTNYVVSISYTCYFVNNIMYFSK